MNFTPADKILASFLVPMLLLLLREEGLESYPQESLALQGVLIKEPIGVRDKAHFFLCGIAIGYAGSSACINLRARMRAAFGPPLHGFLTGEAILSGEALSPDREAAFRAQVA